jgi:hypothetical protein
VNRLFVVLVSFVLVGLAAPAALAKGASEASISGPGLATPLTLAGEGQAGGGGEQLMRIAEEAGFFPAVFAQTPDPMLSERPTGTTLGPEYTVEYVMPGPNNELDTIVQEIYPHAKPRPVTHVRPGQRFWTTEHTVGGWYVATSSLKAALVEAGVPARVPSADRSPSDAPWTALGATFVVVAAAVGGLLRWW